MVADAKSGAWSLPFFPPTPLLRGRRLGKAWGGQRGAGRLGHLVTGVKRPIAEA